jgi:hypothetical protein
MVAREETLSRETQRLKFPGMAWASLSVSSVAGRAVRSGIRPVLIMNLSAEGLGFITSLELPVRQDYRLGFEFDLDGKRLKVEGEVVWKNPEENLFLYGVKLLLDEGTRQVLSQAMERRLQKLAPGVVAIHDLYRRMSEYEVHAKELTPLLDQCR